MKGESSLQLCRQFHDSRKYSFDNVIGPSLAQEKMYEIVAMDVVEDVCSGFNGSILCYGQTGSGKTYTAFGGKAYWDAIHHSSQASPAAIAASCGVVPRATQHLFTYVASQRKKYVD